MRASGSHERLHTYLAEWSARREPEEAEAPDYLVGCSSAADCNSVAGRSSPAVAEVEADSDRRIVSAHTEDIDSNCRFDHVVYTFGHSRRASNRLGWAAEPNQDLVPDLDPGLARTRK